MDILLHGILIKYTPQVILYGTINSFASENSFAPDRLQVIIWINHGLVAKTKLRHSALTN